MPRKNKPEIFSAGLSVARVKEDTRMPRRQELLTNVIRRNTVHTAFPNPYTRGVFEQGLIQRSIFGLLHQNLYLNVHDNHQHHYYDGDHDDYDDYDDDDDDDDDYDDEYEDAQSNASSPLPPHPSLRLLTQEEADKHAKEEQEREERRKEKMERQKLKKLRRKEKKRLEKEQKNKERCELEQNQPSGSNDENVIQNTSKIKTEQSDVDAETEDKSVDGDSTRSSEEPEERMKAADIKSCISPSPRGQSRSPVPGERKGGVRRKKKTTKNTTSRERRRRPDREESPAISQTPPLPRDASADKKENMNGTLEVYSQKTAELAACGHRLASCGQYEQALEYFTEAIKYNPKEYKLFGNRSFCYERLQQYESALQDSEVALSLEPGWIKGHFRQGKALCGLKRYYEASLTYKNILRQESSSVEAASELKRAQCLHLMEMGFSGAEACEALKEHGTLEEALEALFIGGAEPEEGCCRDTQTQLVKGEEEEVEEEEEDEEERGEEDEGWTVLGRSRPHQARRRNAAPLKPVTDAPVKNAPKWEMYSVWVGSMAPTLTIPALHNLFNRAGHVTSVKMLVEQQCAFINYTRMEDCDRAIQLMDGLVVEGTPLAVRYPNRFLNEMNGQDGYPLPASRNPKECFFWRTNGCIKTVGCIFKHIPEHKHIDRDKLRP
ncbi:nucleolin [Gadus macrocephalus]|uniref:nucleolin n=1 Tax=Gadus macrocephalus TaxID=80720 RepID=UPI0028CB27C3|nr:nucleolin [Gadus macrocephalus]